VDRALLRLLRTRGHSPAVERCARLYALAGENGALWFGLALVTRDKRAARILVATLLTNTLIKELVRRPRPVLGPDLPPLTPTIYGRSYPSAHAATSFAGAAALPLPSLPLYAAAGAMALTRPYLGVHYPSDIVAGALLGRALERLL
jgi:decaprenylphosphoryl-5-phosphoribose phosphatase